jgi:hypothetical protein
MLEVDNIKENKKIESKINFNTCIDPPRLYSKNSN